MKPRSELTAADCSGATDAPDGTEPIRSGAGTPQRGTLEVVYTWQDGREEVRYRRPWPSGSASDMVAVVERMRQRVPDTPYSTRVV